jgi:hypothetical protein
MNSRTDFQCRPEEKKILDNKENDGFLMWKEVTDLFQYLKKNKNECHIRNNAATCI